ncbi:metal ABC transporter permease [Nodosilinea sp. LEGE 07088]|uniref:metal ABC transporter permease n=1 Tax=Nodosilinea sp. LEGE 07088 TaxID=2777968 RepID=UPI00188029AB|nr:metal ABC transporter permease [Nodosilinea sp. LEGE 07088]MBE9136021.1 metal ABC transporter permease [Nodosilinea sp. LEGE 07088]
MDWLLDPLSYDFMRQALVASLLVGMLCPVIGTYLIVQRMAMLGDVVAHGVLPGLAIASFFNLPILIGAFTCGLFSTFVITWIRTQSRIKADTAMAITFSTFFSLGITLLTLLGSRVSLEQLLFGDILSINAADVWQIAAIAALVLIGVGLFYKELLFVTFDPLGAEALGLPVHRINIGLMAAITLAIIAGIKTVGVILVVALMIGPAATAYLLVTELHWMMLLGAALGVLFGVVGMYGSYYLDIPSGPAIGLTVFAGFLLALLFSPRQGIVTRRLQRWPMGSR